MARDMDKEKIGKTQKVEADDQVDAKATQEEVGKEHIESSEEQGVLTDEAASESVVRQSGFGHFLKGIWQGLISRQIFQKIFSLVFALGVFGAVYFYMVGHRDILTYMGIMLLMVIVYAEILVIRDHLWVIEGSMRESRKWRDVFFNQTTLRRQRVRKILIMLFALGIFSYVYVKSIKRDPLNTPVLSFMGIILMITILYYEILTIRDEVFIVLQSIKAENPDQEEEQEREKRYEKFLQTDESSASGEKDDSKKDSV